MVERTFSIIKPDAVKRHLIGAILGWLGIKPLNDFFDFIAIDGSPIGTIQIFKNTTSWSTLDFNMLTRHNGVGHNQLILWISADITLFFDFKNFSA